MSAINRQRSEALRQQWRQRLDSMLDGLVPAEQLRDAVLGSPEQHAEYEKEVLHEAVTDRLAHYDSPPEAPRPKRSRLYGWNKLMRGR